MGVDAQDFRAQSLHRPVGCPARECPDTESNKPTTRAAHRAASKFVRFHSSLFAPFCLPTILLKVNFHLDKHLCPCYSIEHCWSIASCKVDPFQSIPENHDATGESPLKYAKTEQQSSGTDCVACLFDSIQNPRPVERGFYFATIFTFLRITVQRSGGVVDLTHIQGNSRGRGTVTCSALVFFCVEFGM